ncbi:MAG: molecular chaperone [Eggerthella lenta]
MGRGGGEILAALGLPAEVPAAAGDPAGPPAARAADAEAAAGADALPARPAPGGHAPVRRGARARLLPYEGVWAAEADGVQPLLFVNPRSMEVERFMRSCGLGRPEGTNEPLDHVATECELLEHLALRAAGAPASEGAPADADLPGGSPAAAYEAFLSGHAQAWMPAFAERLAAEARHPFYRAAAAYLGALVD